jgi:hypothetical protein
MMNSFLVQLPEVVRLTKEKIIGNGLSKVEEGLKAS